MVADADEIEHLGKGPQCHAHPVGAAKAAELPTSFDVRLKIDENAGDSSAFQAPLERGMIVAKSRRMASCPV